MLNFKNFIFYTKHYRLILPGLTFLLSITAVSSQEIFQNPGNIKTRISSFENQNGRKGLGAQTNKGAKGYAFEESCCLHRHEGLPQHF